jgi:hypothetical protein
VVTRNNVPSGAHVMEASRFGSFLRHIPATRRVGDYAHAAARVLNAIFKRIDANAKTWPGRSTAKEIRQVPLSFGPSLFGRPPGEGGGPGKHPTHPL